MIAHYAGDFFPLFSFYMHVQKWTAPAGPAEKWPAYANRYQTPDFEEIRRALGPGRIRSSFRTLSFGIGGHTTKSQRGKKI